MAVFDKPFLVFFVIQNVHLFMSICLFLSNIANIVSWNMKDQDFTMLIEMTALTLCAYPRMFIYKNHMHVLAHTLCYGIAHIFLLNPYLFMNKS